MRLLSLPNTKYQIRISGPLLDRIDIHIEVPKVDYENLSEDRMGESSEEIQSTHLAEALQYRPKLMLG